MNTETNRPLKWVPSAYFAMGLPFVILNMVCVLMFKGLGIADSQIALWTSIIMFPWTWVADAIITYMITVIFGLQDGHQLSVS